LVPDFVPSEAQPRHQSDDVTGVAPNFPLLPFPIEASLFVVSIGEIQQLPLGEKLQIMEAIWEDLRLNAEQVPVPKWHKGLLDARREAVEANREEILDWDEVKHSLGVRKA
jgi:putative addiction module component (TIGR02574 family)